MCRIAGIASTHTFTGTLENSVGTGISCHRRGTGTAATMLAGRRDIKFPSETVLRFRLEQDLRI